MGKVEGKPMNFMFLSPWTSKLPVARCTVFRQPWSLLPFSLHLIENDFCKHLPKSRGAGGYLCGKLLGCAQGTGPASRLPGLRPRCLAQLCHSGDSVSAPAFTFCCVNGWRLGLSSKEFICEFSIRVYGYRAIYFDHSNSLWMLTSKANYHDGWLS